MTTSYLFAYYILDSQVSLSSSMKIKIGLFSFWLSVVSLLQFWYYKLLPCYGKLKKKKKKSGKNKKLRKMHPNNHEKF